MAPVQSCWILIKDRKTLHNPHTPIKALSFNDLEGVATLLSAPVQYKRRGEG